MALIHGKRTNDRKYPGIGGFKHLPRNVMERRLNAKTRQEMRDSLTTEEQLRAIEQRPGQSLRERARLLEK